MTRRQTVLFLVLAALWGSPYALIKVAVEQIPPATLASARLGIGAVALAPLALRRGAYAGLRPLLPLVVGFALIEFAGTFLLIAAGETRIASSLTGILVASVPLVVALLTLADPARRATGLRLVGLVGGMAGVALLLGVDLPGGQAALIGAGMVLLASVGYAIGALLLERRLARRHPEGLISLAMLIASVALLPAALVEAPGSPPSAGAALALVVLGLGPTALAFLLVAHLISEIGPGRASVVAYLAPVFAVAFGVLFLGESVRLTTLAGLALILSGSHLATRARPG